MESSFKLQMDIKNNAQDLEKFAMDLRNWEVEMKKKESELRNKKETRLDIPPPRNKIKRTKPNSEKKNTYKTKKISAYDYTAWDKYDVDKACAELDDEENANYNNKDENFFESTHNNTNNNTKNDSEEDSSSNDEDKLSLIDKAFYEKELGNQFVKKEEWSSAIKCYTNAIDLDPKNPIYYANRSLCFLKLKNFRSAEVDATVAIQLDSKYVKAYQRRGYARLGLGQSQEAKSDFEEVLNIEPKNSLMKLEIEKINSNIKSSLGSNKIKFNHKKIFNKEQRNLQSKTFSESKISEIDFEKSKKLLSLNGVNVGVEGDASKKENTELCNLVDSSKKIQPKSKKNVANIFRDLPQECKILYPIQLPPHKRSKQPLQHIQIQDESVEEDSKKNMLNDKGVEISNNVVVENIKTSKTEEAYGDVHLLSTNIPKTCVQFQRSWKIIKKQPEEAFQYLKNISDSLPTIFENSLESDLFSDLVSFLSETYEEKPLDTVYLFLSNLSRVKRFKSLILFMSNTDKIHIRKCFAELGQIKSKEDISELMELYALQLSID